MKPCKRNRKLIAWSVIGALDEHQKAVLDTHLAQCDGCRKYLDEMSQLSGVLSDKEPCPHIQASEVFHQRLMGKLRRSNQQFGLEALVHTLRHSFPNWKVAFPILGAAVLVVAGILALRHAPSATIRTPATQASQSSQPTIGALDPTISNYKRVANQSFDQFDQLLTEQGTRNLPPPPTYAVSASPLAPGAD